MLLFISPQSANLKAKNFKVFLSTVFCRSAEIYKLDDHTNTGS